MTFPNRMHRCDETANQCTLPNAGNRILRLECVAPKASCFRPEACIAGQDSSLFLALPQANGLSGAALVPVFMEACLVS